MYYDMISIPTIIIISAILALNSWKHYRHAPYGGYRKTLSLAMFLLGVYWIAIYLYVSWVKVLGLPYNSVEFGAIFVRPGMILTLALMTSKMILCQKDRL